MRGEFIGVWCESWREIWLPLTDHEGVPEDIFCELYRELAGNPSKPGALRITPSLEALADVIDNPAQGRAAFEEATAEQLASETALVRFLEAAHPTLDDLGGDPLSNRYFNLVAAFIEKFSLRYDLRRPCTLCPNLPGLLTNLVRHMQSTCQADAHLAKLNHDFEEALRDLRLGRTESRIKSCLTKQYILIEGIANTRGGTSGETLGQRCGQASWPHPTLKAAAGNIYGFRSDYPGLGHAGNAKAALRDVDDRELVGVACMLLGVLPYVDPTINLSPVYGESVSAGRSSVTAREAAPAASPSRSMWKRLTWWAGELVKRR
ncbi:MAG: hypothetical protein LKCHEGNO_00914 [Burkholderiaceae bacterium]|nr:hypothetical protein [Burkholderiaceae bacterium]